MEMTIKESLEWLISRKEHYEMDDNCQELAQALELAIDTMRKYQKIEQIYKDYCFPTKFVNTFDAMENIGKVLRDGNDKEG